VLIGSKEMHPRKNHAAFAHEGIALEFHSFVGASWYYDYNIEHMFLSRGNAANQRDFIVLTCGVRLMEVIKETPCSNQYCNFVCPHAWQGQHKA
jgi:hypothetical protein